MDPFQYLIAPYELRPKPQKDQQPSPVITSIPINHERFQQHQPTTPVTTQDLYQQNLTQTAPYAQAPISMPLPKRHSAPDYTSSAVSSFLYGNSNDGSPSVSQYQQPQQPPATSGVLDREHLIQGLAAHPDILASLLRNGGLAGLITTMQNTRQPATSTNHSTESAIEATRSKTPQITPAVPIVETRQICFWWYHNGNCNKHPQSSNFNGTQDHCRFLHHLINDDEMINVTQQHFPGHWHKRGDCRLERCRFSSTYRHLSRPFQEQRQEKLMKSRQQSQKQSQSRDWHPSQQEIQYWQQLDRSPAPTQHHQNSPASQSDGSSNGQPATRIFTGLSARRIPVQSNPTVPTSPAAGRNSKGRYQHHHQQLSPKSSIPTPTLERKVSALSPLTGPTNPTNPSAKIPKLTKNQRKKLAKDERTTAKLAMTTLAAPKYFDVVPCLTSGFPSHTNTPCKKKTQTCFFWYHGICGTKGSKCHMVHTLLPGYVQPPMGYVHEGLCTRDWCPGDWMWEHEGDLIERERPRSEIYGHLEENEKDDDVVMEDRSGTDDAELSHEDAEIDGEW